MAEEADIWRAAGLLVDQQGRDSLEIASRQAEALDLQGDHVGAATWRRIRAAAEALLTTRTAG